MKYSIQTMAAFTTMLIALFSMSIVAAETEYDTDRARVNYMLHCQGCHLPDGRGFPGRVPDMRHTLVPLLSLEGGREFIVQVPGTATSALLSDELAELLNWMIAEIPARPPSSTVAAFTAVEVEDLRKTPLVNVTETRNYLSRPLDF